MAIDARKREVIESVASAMYLRIDVLDVKSSRRIVLVQPAVALRSRPAHELRL
jgi:hypothetical protein